MSAFERSSSGGGVDGFVQSFLDDLCFWQCGDGSLPPTTKALSEQGFDDALQQFQAQSFDSLRSETELRWQVAVDPATGRTYYYDSVTMETQWKKPAEIRRWEKHARREQRKRDKTFFKDMECNVVASLQRGELIPGLAAASLKQEREQEVPLRQDSHPGVKVRTLSGMDERVLASLHDSISNHNASCNSNDSQANSLSNPKPSSQQTSSKTKTAACRDGRPPLPTQRSQNRIQQQPTATNKDQPRSAGQDTAGLEQSSGIINTTTTTTTSSNTPSHVRRNTSGSNPMVDSTLINPNVVATIRCVCGIYRAHIVQGREFMAAAAAAGPAGFLPNVHLDLFLDGNGGNSPLMASVPSVDEIVTFYTEYYETSKMQEDTIIMSLVYLERLIKKTCGALRPTPQNWRSLLFSCMVLASKVWDDFSMWNVDFSEASHLLSNNNEDSHKKSRSSNNNNNNNSNKFSLHRINQLEVTVLSCLAFDVRVTDSEYAKYYFSIRSIMVLVEKKSAQQKQQQTQQQQQQQSLKNHQQPLSAITNTASNSTLKRNISSTQMSPSQHVHKRVSAANGRRCRSADWNILSQTFRSSPLASAHHRVAVRAC